MQSINIKNVIIYHMIDFFSKGLSKLAFICGFYKPTLKGLDNELDNFTLNDLLHSEKFFSKDIKQKITNKQLLINDKPIKLEDLKLEISSYIEAGDFLYKNMEQLRPFCIVFGFEALFDREMTPQVQHIVRLLEGVSLLRITKKRLIIIKFKNNLDLIK